MPSQADQNAYAQRAAYEQQMAQQQGGPQLPPMPPNPVREQLKAQIENEILEQLMPELNEIMEVSGDNEGVLELKEKELTIRSQENKDDKTISEEKLKLDREKMERRDETDEEKIRSQEDIAALRASISREKMNQPKGK